MKLNVIIRQTTEEEYSSAKKQDAKINRVKKINSIKAKITEISQYLIQAQAGVVIEDIEEKKQEAQELHKELNLLTSELGVEEDV